MLRLSLVLPVLCLLLGGLILAGCETKPQRPGHTEISFTDQPPIKLNVRVVEVEQAYKVPHTAPNVEHLLATPPAAAAARWAQDRLSAVGAVNQARFIVREASVVEVSLKQSGGVTGALTTEQSERYDARLVIEIVIRSEQEGSSATLTAEVTRSRTVPENLTLFEREAVWHQMTRTMMTELDTLLARDIKKAFFPYLVL